MSKILLIGNSGDISKSTDGQVTKVRLYRDILKKENAFLVFVDLERFSRHPFRTLIKIKKSINECDRIILITAQRGVKVLIPFIIFCNRKLNKPFVLPMIGVNILHYYIDKLDCDAHYLFMHNCNFLGIKPRKKDIKNFKKITYILPENKMVADVVSTFFGLHNVKILENFRDCELIKCKKKSDSKLFKLVFLSRVTNEKGIFQLFDAIDEINKNENIVSLDIFGQKFFNSEEENEFNSRLNEFVRYKGVVENNQVVNVLKEYDSFVFPTQFKSEGTPGVISEALIAGLPVISSNFSQVNCLLRNNVDSIIYDMDKTNKLVEAIMLLVKDKTMIKYLSRNAKISGQKYTYKYNRKKFCSYILGLENSKII